MVSGVFYISIRLRCFPVWVLNWVLIGYIICRVAYGLLPYGTSFNRCYRPFNSLIMMLRTIIALSLDALFIIVGFQSGLGINLIWLMRWLFCFTSFHLITISLPPLHFPFLFPFKIVFNYSVSTSLTIVNYVLTIGF